MRVSCTKLQNHDKAQQRNDTACHDLAAVGTLSKTKATVGKEDQVKAVPATNAGFGAGDAGKPPSK